MTSILPQRNPVETIKLQSHGLRGRIVEELADGGDHVSNETAQLLRQHGIYQQEDRDKRRHLGEPGKPAREPEYSFMVRAVVPAGRLSSEQFMAHLDLCQELGNGVLRLTTRQNLQIYGLRKVNLVEAVRRIHATGLSTLGGGGDLRRNVMCCPAPYCRDPVHRQIQGMAFYLFEELRPQMPSYGEIWLGQSPSPVARADEEPLYGDAYLPRKFKVAVGLPGDNCVDLYAQDVGLMAICENFQVVGYNVLVGGGMGNSPRRPDTFPALAQRMALIRPDQAADTLRAIVAVYRDFGNRTDRNLARLKYLLAAWGLAKFKAEVERRLGYTLPGPHPHDVWDVDDHIGWHEQGDGRWFYGLHLDGGRIADVAHVRLKSALQDICGKYRPPIGLTPGGAVLFCDVPIENRAGIEDILRRHGVKLHDELSNVRRWSRACVALPFCSRAVTEGERALPVVLDQLEVDLANLGLADERLTVRMSGCPNGCGHPYNADVGLVGRAAGRYAVFLGGRRLPGDRLGFLYQDGVPLERVAATLRPLLAYFKQDRHPGEAFGDFCHRKGREDLTVHGVA